MAILLRFNFLNSRSKISMGSSIKFNLSSTQTSSKGTCNVGSAKHFLRSYQLALSNLCPHNRGTTLSAVQSLKRRTLLGLKRLHGFLEVTTAQVLRFGINKWYQSFALRNFDLEDMEFKSTNSGTTAKLPILKLGEYEMWVIRIKQYFQIQDYALWEVIENGDSWVSVPQTTQENGTSVTKMSIPVTAEEKTNKKNDVKARGLLLMALPNEHQLTFSQYPDAKSMFAAIKTRFGGNAATKKTQKTLLKQQYENFSASSAESLDSIFNRLQKIVSSLAILGVIIAQEDLNLKLLSSLPPELNTHVVVWMNKPEVKTMSIDDLYNNFKIVEQKIKKYVDNGDSWVSVPQTTQENGTSVTKMSIPVTAEEKTNKKDDVMARSLLLMALPNEHQLTFSQYPDAKLMLLSRNKNLRRLQKIISRLAILGVVIAQEDLNLKFLSSLPPEWNTQW
ncbi:hypothetical protein Tco_0500388 [Tanacetum coccineum]